MKPYCCDTSFIVSYYGNDVHTPKTRAYVQTLRGPMTLSPFNEFEMENALRFAIWRGLLTFAQYNGAMASCAADVRAGRIVLAKCDLSQVLNEARRLSATHTILAGHRAYDILHVAASLVLGADHFLSFDANQRRLAAAEGLRLNP